jgi:hypothetical protein
MWTSVSSWVKEVDEEWYSTVVTRTWLHRLHHGKVVHVDSVKLTLKPPGAERLKLICDELLSCFAFRFNVRRYITGCLRQGRRRRPSRACCPAASRPTSCAPTWQGLALVHFSAQPEPSLTQNTP